MSLTIHPLKGDDMADVKYLTDTIAEVRETERPCWGMTREGYTQRSGAPTGWMIRLAGESRWRRVMAWQFSNAGTLFVRVRGEALVIPRLFA